ncbi:hypothetical protein [Terriglobus roseus]|uniref:Uncharacterized protein n=1 Tax=Terriglobus roseus TaxID=392734 RepID=A0A1G7HPE0_9BACT|nr:hypothetical protein [Terriglobus roseus]SDF01859.1 hypothetical protein SAMN05444167_1145 [Terriglobus roseus]
MSGLLRIALTSITIWLSTLSACYSQQYMKAVSNVDDAKFDSWVKRHEISKCRAVAPAAYPDGPGEVMVSPKPSGVCYWDIDRTAEVAPPPLSLHARTRIVVRIKHPRPDESINPSVVYAKIAPPSPGNDVLKNAVNPLQTIQPSPAVGTRMFDKSNLPSATLCDTKRVGVSKTAAQACQAYLINTVNSILVSVNHANAALACFENYQIAQPAASPEVLVTPPSIAAYKCDSTVQIDPEEKGTTKQANFAYQKALVKAEMEKAISLLPPTGIFKIFDNYIQGKSDSFTDEIAGDAPINSGILAVQSAQATLQQNDFIMMQIPDSVPSRFYYYDVPALTAATATITATEVISKASNTISTWTANANSYNIVFSAGLGFANLVNRSYANTPQVNNGKPVLDDKGNTVAIVTETDTRLAVLAPEVLGSYLLPLPRKAYTLCSFGCSLLVSGGLGANLTSKTADFDTGISLRLSDFLLTPAIHFGREQRLINGVTVGEQIGAGAPSTLATQSKWVRKFGFVLTYNIPLL